MLSKSKHFGECKSVSTYPHPEEVAHVVLSAHSSIDNAGPRSSPVQDGDKEGIFVDAQCRSPMFPFLMQQLSERAHCEMWDTHLGKRGAAETPGKLTLSMLILELTLTFYKQMLMQVHINLPNPCLHAIFISS